MMILMFFDLEKAYDKANHVLLFLWEVLNRMDVPQQVIRVLKV